MEESKPEIVTTTKALTVKNLFARDEVKAKFQELLGKRAPAFITSVLQVVAQSNNLAKADPHSVYHAAAVAATLNLPINPNLGFAYIIPYNKNFKEGDQWKKIQLAQFQMGYKGFIQLCQRTGQFKTVNVTDVRSGEIIVRDRLRGLFEFNWIENEDVRLATPVIGYVSYFQLLNGFEKTFYMSMREVRAHGEKYSKSWDDAKSLWKTDFDSMAMKTVLKLNLAKYAPMSVEMERAIITDQAVINDSDTLDVTYIDNDGETNGEDDTKNSQVDPALQATLDAINKARGTNPI